MLFTDFIKAAVQLVMGSAAALIAITVLAATRLDDNLTLIVGGSWCVAAVIIGMWVGRHSRPSQRIKRLLAGARTTNSLPDLQPALIFWNRLWSLGIFVIACGILSWFFPQVAAIGAGYLILAALIWRNQASAVKAIENRDGTRFFVDKTSPLKPMRVLRAPGWRRSVPSGE